MKQVERVLADLRAAGLRGVCAEHWYRTACPNARNRVGELRRAGHHIESSVCQDDHDGTPYARYCYVHGPERRCLTCPPRVGEVTQQRLIAV